MTERPRFRDPISCWRINTMPVMFATPAVAVPIASVGVIGICNRHHKKEVQLHAVRRRLGG